MTVSLVKITADTLVYVTGHNHAGYMPEGEVALHATIASARDTLAWELDSLADFVAEGELSGEDATGEFTTDDLLSSSIAASAGYVKSDPDVDIEWSVLTHGGWTTMEDTGDGIDTAYWIQTSTLGEQFPEGDDGSEEYAYLLEALQDAAMGR